MKKNISLLTFALLLAVPVTAFALALTNPLSGVGTLPDLIRNIANYISGIIGFIAIIMFIYAGIIFVTSAGDGGKVTEAKRIVIWASIGVGVVLAADGLIALVKVILEG